jgi:heptaprenyl diphosphate synthase
MSGVSSVMAGAASLLALPHVREDLVRVEETLHEAVASGEPFLAEVARHLVLAGGKRLRPALAITAAGALRDQPASATNEVVRGAVAVELVHLGSLYHDDVMDEADTRRGVESVNARWGNLVAIVGGDFLLARASEIAAALGPEPAQLLAATIAALCEGQVGELTRAFDVARSEETYLAAIASKTAALMSTSCRIGAMVAGLERSTVDTVTEYGRLVGMAFQIVDDILDVVATDEQLGKPAGNDLVEGVYTLPVIRALAAQQGDELRAILGRRLERDAMVRARDMVRSDGAVGAAADVARAYTAEANALLDDLPATPATDALRAFAIDLVESVPAPA